MLAHATAAPTPLFQIRSRIGSINKRGTSDDRDPESSDRDRCRRRHRQSYGAGLARGRHPGSPIVSLWMLAASAREQGNATELLTIATDLTDDRAEKPRAELGEAALMVRT